MIKYCKRNGKKNDMNNSEKVCILLGSPDLNGNTAAMCKNAAVFLDSGKIKYKIYDLYDEETDFIFYEIKRYDVVLIATPIHSFFCSDAVKEFMDFSFESEGFFDEGRKKNGKKIRCGIMVSHGYDEEYAVGPFETGIKRWCEHVGMAYEGKISIRDTGDSEKFFSNDNLKKFEKFIGKMCGMERAKRENYLSGENFFLEDAHDEKKTFERLFNLYIYEMSSYAEWMGECMTDDAVFIPDRLSEYFEMPEKRPFIIKVDDKTAGLAVFSFPDKTKEPDEADYYVEEIFILKAYREKHFAEAVIKELWKKNKGVCAVCALKKNIVSVKFWNNIIKKSGYEYIVEDDEDIFFYRIMVD